MKETELLDKLRKFKYPVYLIINGPERTYRTKFRSEHSGYFSSDIKYSSKDVIDSIKHAYDRYEGLYNEMDIILVFVDDNNELDQTQL